MTYKGLIIGGPKDGQWLEHSAPAYYCVVLESLPDAVDIHLANGNKVELAETKKYEYYHREFVAGYFIWCARDTPWPLIVDRLMACYRPAVGKLSLF